MSQLNFILPSVMLSKISNITERGKYLQDNTALFVSENSITRKSVDWESDAKIAYGFMSICTQTIADIRPFRPSSNH